MSFRKGAVAALAATVMLVAAGNAFGGRLSVNERTFNAYWSELTFRTEGISTACHVYITGSLHAATFAKTRGLLVGYATSGFLPTETCRGTEGARPTPLDASLPWHIKYNSFTGTLPRITGINFDVVGMSFQVTILGVSCLYRSTAESPARVIANLSAEGTVTSVRAEEAARIPSTGGFCPASGTASGSGEVEVIESENGMIVRLI
ncbi:MAG: hypothetical protein JSS99_06560 [Actinobacteria bacterium]|nr:hypothetical protein [Actinomycetota bacterium]